MTVKYWFPLGRDVWCPAYGHHKSAEVCRAQPYESCKGCAVLIADRDRYGSRLFRIVESAYDPSAFAKEYVKVSLGRREWREPTPQPEGVAPVTSDAGTMGKAFERLVSKKGSKRGKAKRQRR